MKTKSILLRSLFAVMVFFCFSQSSIAQIQATMAVRGTINSFGNDAMTYRSGLATSWIATVQATATNASAGFLFANNGSFSPKWANGGAVSFNTKTTWFASGADGTYSQTNGNFYTYIIRDIASGTNTDGYLFQTSAAPVSVSTVTQSILASSVTVGQSVTITATTSASLPTGQGVFLRYSTNAFSSSTVVNMTGSGSTYTASIPGGTNTSGANVVYYVFTSGGTTPPAAADCDLATINLNNNSGSNYSYTVNTPAAIYVHAFEGTLATPYTATPNTLNTNLNTSSWTNSAGSFVTFAGASGNALSLSAVNLTQTYTLSLNIAGGFSASVTSFSFWTQRSGTGPTGWSMNINGIAAGSGTLSGTSGVASGTLTVSNLIGGQTGTLTAIITLTGGSGGTFRLDDYTLNGNLVAQPGPPALSSPTVSVTGTTTATLGANITSNGGATITARGTSWKGTSPVLATDNQVAEGGTATGVYTQARTGFSPQTQYFYVGYATNTNGTAISSEGNFRTWSNPATVQPSSFSTTPGSSSLVANWTTATFPVSGATQAGYVVIYSTGTPSLTSANGTAPAGVGTLINITPTVLPVTPALTTTISGLTNGQLYNLLIVPYTWDGTNATTYNYLTSGALTTTGTPAAVTYTWSGGSGSWATPGNWSPAGPPSTDDIVVITSNPTISSVPTITLRSLTVNNNNSVTLTPLTGASRTVTLINTSTSLTVGSGSTLNIQGSTSGSTDLTVAFGVASGNIATIAGTLNLQLGAVTGKGNYTATNAVTTVSGVLSATTGSAIASTASNLIISQTGTFQMNGSASAVPAANWTAGTPGANLRLSQTASTNLTGLSAITFQNITVDGTTVAFNSSASTISFTIAGNFTHTSGAGNIELGSGSGTTNLSVGGSFQNTVGTVITTTSATNATITFTGNNSNIQCISSSWTNFIVAASATRTLNGNFALNSNNSSSPATSFTVNATGLLNSGANNITGGTGANSFVLIAGGTLGIGSPAGITTTGNASGNIQTITRTFPAGGNYTYNGAVNQVTGNALPATISGILTIANTGSNPTNVVTLSQATSTSGTLSLTNGVLDLNALTLTLSSNAAQSIAGNAANTFNITGAAGSTLALSSGGTSHVVTLSNFGTGLSANLITGTTVNVQLNANTQLDCAGNGTSTSMLTVLGTFTMNSATASNIANVHPPFYGAASTLLYNANYGRFSEWNATSGPGYPNNVTVTGSTTLDVVNGVNTYKKAAGNLTVNTGSTFSIPALTTGNGSGVGVEFLGNIINDGTISLNSGANTTSQRLKGANLTNGNSNTTAIINLSGAAGGDLELTGNYVDNAVFNANARAVFFTGTGTQTIGGTATAPFNIDYIVVTKASGSVQMLTDLLTEGPNGGNAITLTSSTDILDLNGHALTLGKTGVASTISGSGLFKGSNTSSMTILGTGAFGTINFAQTPFPSNGLQNLTINRTSTGSVTLGSSLYVFSAAAFTAGIFDVTGTTLRLGGTVTTGGGTITVGTLSTVLFNGISVAQSVPAGLFTGNSAYAINIDNQPGVTFNGSMAITNSLQVFANSTFIPAPGVVISGAGTLSGLSVASSVAKVTLATGTADFTTQYTLNKTLTNIIIEFAGTTGPQGMAANTFGGLRINNSAGVTMAGNVTVGLELTSTSGDLTIGSNTLTATKITNTGGNLVGSIASNVIITGTGSSVSFTSGGTSNYLKALTLNTGAAATLATDLNITDNDGGGNEGVLSVIGSAQLTIAATKVVALKSNATGTARIADNRDNNTYSNNTSYIVGDVSVERYIPANPAKSWRLLASNTTGQNIHEAWQENQGPLADPGNGFGTMITGRSSLFGGNVSTANAAGFDALSPGTTLFKYTPSTDNLDPVSATNTGDITDEEGYFLFIRGDRTSGGHIDVGTPTAPTTTTVLRSTGTLFMGDQGAVSTGTQKWALVRNPYASRIDMTKIVRGGNLVDEYQVWDPKLTGANGVGGYQTFTKNINGIDYENSTSGGSYGPAGTINNYIESGLAFFINSTTVSPVGTAQVTEQCKYLASGSAEVNRPAAASPRFYYSLNAGTTSSPAVYDGGYIDFDASLTNAVDILDARKSINFGENFGLYNSATDIVVERRALITVTDTFFFRMTGMKRLAYTLEFNPRELIATGLGAFLEDKYLGTSTYVSLEVLTAYNFTVDANAGSAAADRFRIVFKPLSPVPVTFTAIRAQQVNNNIAVEWKVTNQVNIVRYEMMKSTDGRNFTKVATQEASNSNSTNVTYNWLDENAVTGANYYRVKSVGSNGQVKYSEIVKVVLGKGGAAITVSPNPVEGNIMNLQLVNQAAGKYAIRLFNTAGQLMYSNAVQHNGGSASESFVLPSAIIKGIYQLEVIGQDNTKQVQQLIIN